MLISTVMSIFEDFGSLLPARSVAVKFQICNDELVQTLLWTSHGPVWTSLDQSPSLIVIDV